MVINKLKRYIFYFLFFIFIGFNCYSQGDSLNYYNEKVNASFEEKNYNNALKYAQCVLSKDSLNQNAIFKKAESQFYSNLYLESIKTAQFIIRNKIGNQIHILTIKGIAEDMVFNYRQSNLDFKELLKIDSINRVAFYRIGYNNYYLRDFVTAEKYLKKAYKLNPNIFEPIKYLAESYIKLHNNDSALHYFEKALAINNNAEDILVGKSKVYYALQKYTMAESLLIKANNIKETYDAYLNLAIIYEVIGNNTKWYESLVKLKQFNKSTEDELLSEIKFLFKVNEFQSILEKTNEIIPKHTLNLNYFIYFRGKAHEGLKEYENAINDFKTVEYKLNGAYNVSLSIGLCYEKMKKYDLALPYYYEAVKQMPDNKDALYYKSKLCFEMKKFEESKQGFLKLLKYKESPEIYDKLVNISFMKKNNNQALIYSDKGLSISKKGSEDEFTLTADKINSLLMLKDYKTALNIIDNFKTDDVSLLPSLRGYKCIALFGLGQFEKMNDVINLFSIEEIKATDALIKMKLFYFIFNKNYDEYVKYNYNYCNDNINLTSAFTILYESDNKNISNNYSVISEKYALLIDVDNFEINYSFGYVNDLSIKNKIFNPVINELLKSVDSFEKKEIIYLLIAQLKSNLNIEDAINYYNKAIEYNPSFKLAYRLRGTYYKNVKKDNTAAEKDFIIADNKQ